MSLERLPSEIRSLILQKLPLTALLKFALTSRCNYDLARATLSTLNLAVFSKKIHGVLAFLNTDDSAFLGENGNSTRYQIVVSTTQKRSTERKDLTLQNDKDASLQPPPVQRQCSIDSQNSRLEKVMSSTILSELSSLTIHTYSLSSSALGMLMAKHLSRLRHLTFNFSHPYIHDTTLPAHYWEICPDIAKDGSPAWNAFASLGDEYAGVLRATSLQTLTLTRAAITSVQLSKWIEMNVNLSEIRLNMVAGVDQRFVESLMKLRAIQSCRAPLKILKLERCPNLHLQNPPDFEWIQAMLAMGLEELTFTGCENVNSNALRRSCEGRGWTSRGALKVVYPDECPDVIKSLDRDNLAAEQRNQVMKWRSSARERLRTDEYIEVDPAYVGPR